MQASGLQPVAAAVAGGNNGQPLVLYHQGNLKNNVTVATHTRIFAALLAGLVAGILGVTGLKGFLVFILSQLLNAALLFLKSAGLPQKYFVGSPTLFLSGLASQTELLTFLLFWTLSNNLVYLF